MDSRGQASHGHACGSAAGGQGCWGSGRSPCDHVRWVRSPRPPAPLQGLGRALCSALGVPVGSPVGASQGCVAACRTQGVTAPGPWLPGGSLLAAAAQAACLRRYQRGCRSLAANLQPRLQGPEGSQMPAETADCDSDGDYDVPEDVESVIGGWDPHGPGGCSSAAACPLPSCASVTWPSGTFRTFQGACGRWPAVRCPCHSVHRALPRGEPAPPF